MGVVDLGAAVDAAPTAQHGPSVNVSDVEAVAAAAQWAGAVVVARPRPAQAERGGQVGGCRGGFSDV